MSATLDESGFWAVPTVWRKRCGDVSVCVGSDALIHVITHTEKGNIGIKLTHEEMQDVAYLYEQALHAKFSEKEAEDNYE